MRAISQGSPATEIAHFERMDINGLSLNSLILTRKQAVRRRERNSLLVHAHHHTLAHSLFFLFDSFFLSKFPVFSLIFHSFSYLFFFCFISHVFLPPSSILLCCPYCAWLRPFLYCLLWRVFTVLPFNCFCPGIGVLPKPPVGMLATQPSPLTCADHATFHSLTKEFYFVFFLPVAFPSK